MQCSPFGQSVTHQRLQVFIDLDVGKAKAFYDSDRDRILKQIREDVGSLDTMTHTLKNALVVGALSQVPPEDGDWNDGVYSQVNCAAALCRLYGRLLQAETLYRRALAAFERVLGAEHPDTLSSVNNLANLLKNQGKNDEAEPLYRRALAAQERVMHF